MLNTSVLGRGRHAATTGTRVGSGYQCSSADNQAEDTHRTEPTEKLCIDLCRRDLEFEVGDHMFLKVAPVRGGVEVQKEGQIKRKVHRPLRDFRESLPLTKLPYHRTLPLCRMYSTCPCCESTL